MNQRIKAKVDQESILKSEDTNKAFESAGCLVLFNDKFFYCRVSENGIVIGTLYPSAGYKTSYLEADKIVRNLRKRGYQNAVVTTIWGAPVSLADLELLEPGLFEEKQ